MTAPIDGCSVCGHKVFARGWCSAHYFRWRKHGDVQADKPVRGRSARRGEEPALVAVMACVWVSDDATDDELKAVRKFADTENKIVVPANRIVVKRILERTNAARAVMNNGALERPDEPEA